MVLAELQIRGTYRVAQMGPQLHPAHMKHQALALEQWQQLREEHDQWAHWYEPNPYLPVRAWSEATMEILTHLGNWHVVRDHDEANHRPIMGVHPLLATSIPTWWVRLCIPTLEGARTTPVVGARLCGSRPAALGAPGTISCSPWRTSLSSLFGVAYTTPTRAASFSLYFMVRTNTSSVMASSSAQNWPPVCTKRALPYALSAPESHGPWSSPSTLHIKTVSWTRSR